MSKKNNDQNQVPEETKEETPEEVTEASQEKQESSQEEALQQALPAAGGVRQLPQAKPEGKGKRLDHRQGGHHQGTAPGV